MDTESGESSLPAWVHTLSGQVVCILTYGCTYNEGDSARLQDILTHRGSVVVGNPEDAWVVILNTCVVIGKTERKMIRTIREMEANGKEVWVTGCLPSARSDILREFPSVRVLLPQEIHAISDQAPSDASGPVAVVQAGSGCLGHCSYCITRIARGRIQSVPQEEITNRIRAAVSGGAVEIRLTGQDLSAYGCDQGISALPSLLQKIGSIEGRFLVRLGMMNPATLIPIVEDVADALCNEHFFSFIHLPVQSGSDTVLSRMERGYTVSGYMDLVRILRKKLPDISIATDIIAGFPGESEEEFNRTRDLLIRLRPDMVNITRYSYRPGSSVSREYELPDRICKDRSRELVRTGYQILKERKQEMVGKTGEILITEQLRPGTVMGRSRSYTGVVVGENLTVGDRYLVEFSGERTHYLTGEVISPVP